MWAPPSRPPTSQVTVFAKRYPMCHSGLHASSNRPSVALGWAPTILVILL